MRVADIQNTTRPRNRLNFLSRTLSTAPMRLSPCGVTQSRTRLGLERMMGKGRLSRASIYRLSLHAASETRTDSIWKRCCSAFEREHSRVEFEDQEREMRTKQWGIPNPQIESSLQAEPALINCQAAKHDHSASSCPTLEGLFELPPPPP